MTDAPASPAAPAPADSATAVSASSGASPVSDGEAKLAAAKVGADPFSVEEYRQFAEEDGRAGQLIGWLLCALFIYTILVASAAIWWTIEVR